MPREGFDITHQLDSPSACRRAANTARKRNGEAPVTTLVWTDLEHFGASHAVKPGPVKTVICMVQFTHDRGHKGHVIRFALGQGCDSLGDFGVVDLHLGLHGACPDCLITLGTPATMAKAHGADTDQTRSIAMAVPSPPPMQIAATPRLRSRFSKAFSSVTMIRAPLAPMGWPSAQAPPLTFTFSRGRPISCMKAMGTTAKASFTSQRSTSSLDQPSDCRSFCAAGTGAVVNQPGACAWLAWPMMRARMFSPRASAASREASRSAAAPSLIDEELAGVTVPSLRKAGFNCGILSGRALAGCSSSEIVTSPLRVCRVTGAISAAIAPDFCAASAPSREPMA